MKVERVEIYRTHSHPEMQGVRLLLEEAGYSPTIIGERLQGVIGDVPMLEGTAMQLHVERSQAEAARRLIDEMLERKKQTKSGDDYCLVCGKFMASSSSCEACGWSYEVDALSVDAVVPDVGSREQPTEPIQPLVAAVQEQAAQVPRDATALKWDLAVVLALCVVPGITRSVWLFLNPTAPQPGYALDLVELWIQTSCVSLVLLRYMFLSGWKCHEFGLVRPRVSDVILGVGLAVIGYAGLPMFRPLLPFTGYVSGFHFPRASTTSDYVWMVICHAANAFQEELAMRGVLITLFLRAWQSPSWAVIAAASCFASYHFYLGLAGVQEMFVIGLCFVGLFLVMRRVWPFVFAHWFYNMMLELLT